MSRSYLLLLCCASLCWAGDREWSWACYPVPSQEGVQVEHLLGSWVLVELVPNGGQNDTDLCYFVDIERTNDSSVLQYKQQAKHNGSLFPITPITITMVSPTRWLMDDNEGKKYSGIVFDLPADGSSLAVTACGSIPGSVFQSTYVLGRNHSVNFEQINERVQRAGIQGVDNPLMLNPSDCLPQK